MTWDKDGYNEMHNTFKSRYYADKFAKTYLGKDEYTIQKVATGYYIHKLSDLEIKGIKQV